MEKSRNTTILNNWRQEVPKSWRYRVSESFVVLGEASRTRNSWRLTDPSRAHQRTCSISEWERHHSFLRCGACDQEKVIGFDNGVGRGNWVWRWEAGLQGIKARHLSDFLFSSMASYLAEAMKYMERSRKDWYRVEDKGEWVKTKEEIKIYCSCQT